MVKKRIPNTTRAEHKKKLEQAVHLQNAAMRQVREQNIFKNKNNGDVYEQVVKAGLEMLEEDYINNEYEKIKSYYSRSDIQLAMYNYAKGRKISVLKNFHPMFSGSTLRKPEDVLPIMMFYSRELPLWSSMHGTVSRYDDDGNSLCDLVVEVDCKKSRVKCFNLTRPLIRLFYDLELEFRIKYSGNASSHVIIPGEVFPEKWRRDGNRRYLYAKLLDFFREQIKEPKLLDGSFRNSSHFLRLAYSLNENTGLASIPIGIDDFDRFSWQSAYPDSVVVLEDWWDIPNDAQDRTESLIEFALGEKRTFAVRIIDDNSIQENLTHSRPDVISKNTKIGMIKAGEEIIEQFSALSSSMGSVLKQDILNEFSISLQNNVDQRQIIKILAQKYGINKADLVLLWNWSTKTKALEYYARKDVQEFIYSYSLKRCVILGNTDEYFVLDDPSVIFPLVAYVVSEGMKPAFRCTNAKYESDSEKMIACDVVININQPDVDVSIFDMPCFALYAGEANSKIIIPSEESSPSQLSEIKNKLAKNIKSRLKRNVSISIYESSTPIPYTITDDGESIYLPVKIDDLINCSPSLINVSAITTLTNVQSLLNL
jgi:hypothetical protein